MGFKELCSNGSFLLPDFNSTNEGLIVDPDYYVNPLNKLQRISLGILFFLLAGISVLGNSLALFTTYKRKLQVLYKCCVITQCVNDLLMAIFVGVNSLNNFIQETIVWKFGSFMCCWIPYITTLSALLSSIILTCIAIDRYQGVVLLSAKWDPKLTTATFMVTCLLIAAAGTTIPTFLSYRETATCFIDVEAKTFFFGHLCVANRTISSIYFIIIFTLIFLPLLIVFISTYGVIAWILRTEKKRDSSQEISMSASTVDTHIENNDGKDSNQKIHNVKDSNQKIHNVKDSHSKKKLRTFTIILIIMATFIVCRLPQWIFIVITAFPGYKFTGNFWWIVKYMLSALSLANTTINPFIYSFLNDLMNLKSNLAVGMKNWKKAKFRNIRNNLLSSTSKK